MTCSGCGEETYLEPTAKRGGSYHLLSADGQPHAQVCPALKRRTVGLRICRSRGKVKLSVAYREAVA